MTRGLAARAGALICGVFLAFGVAGEVLAAQEVTFLLPSSPSSPAFGPWQLAKARGYYEKEGLNVIFQAAKGGVDVARQVAAGNVPCGAAVGDTPLMVRPSGVLVKAVAVLGGRSLMQLAVNPDRGIKGLKDLRGKIVSTSAYQDTTYYVLLGMLAKVGLGRSDLQIEAAGREGVWKMFVAGSAVAMAAIPDWIALAEAEGAKVRIVPPEEYFRGMAQAILVSDDMIRDNPELIEKLVRATLHGMTDIMADPSGAAKDYVKSVPEQSERLAYITRVFEIYSQYVYPGQKVPGQMDRARLEAIQEFYSDSGIMRTRLPLDELYTNKFVQASP